MVRVWSCKDCSYYLPGKGCQKEEGCDIVNSLIKLEKMIEAKGDMSKWRRLSAEPV